MRFAKYRGNLFAEGALFQGSGDSTARSPIARPQANQAVALALQWPSGNADELVKPRAFQGRWQPQKLAPADAAKIKMPLP
jgi:hypothetical protein